MLPCLSTQMSVFLLPKLMDMGLAGWQLLTSADPPARDSNTGERTWAWESERPEFKSHLHYHIAFLTLDKVFNFSMEFYS